MRNRALDDEDVAVELRADGYDLGTLYSLLTRKIGTARARMALLRLGWMDSSEGEEATDGPT